MGRIVDRSSPESKPQVPPPRVPCSAGLPSHGRSPHDSGRVREYRPVTLLSRCPRTSAGSNRGRAGIAALLVAAAAVAAVLVLARGRRAEGLMTGASDSGVVATAQE